MGEYKVGDLVTVEIKGTVEEVHEDGALLVVYEVEGDIIGDVYLDPPAEGLTITAREPEAG